MDITTPGHLGFELYQRMREAVSRNNPGDTSLLSKLEGDCLAFLGQPFMLRDWLKIMGSSDPYEATARAVLTDHRIHSKREAAELGPITSGTLSGQTQTRQKIEYENGKDGRKTILGINGASNIIGFFGTEEQRYLLTEEGRRKTDEKKRRMGDRAVRNYAQTLEEVLADPSKERVVQKYTDRRQIHAILGLDEELRKRFLMLDRLRYGGTAFVPVDEDAECRHLIVSDPRGMLLTRIKKKYDELPEMVQLAYRRVVSPLVDTSDKEFRFDMGVLMAYDALHSHITTEAAVGSFIKDLDYIMKNRDSPIIRDFPEPFIPPDIRDLLKRPTITMIDATRILEAYNIDMVRASANGSYRRKSQAEYDYAMQELGPLFVRDGKLREPSPSLPLERLKKSIYYSVLSQDELRAVKDICTLNFLAKGDDNALSVACIEDYMAKIDLAVLSSRKIKYMWNMLTKDGVVVPDHENAGETTQRYMYLRERAKHLEAVENFEKIYGQSLEEVRERVREFRMGKRNERENMLNTLEEATETANEFGLFLRTNRLDKAIERVNILISYKDLRQVCEDAKYVLNHRLVLNKHSLLPYISMEHGPDGVRRYFRPHDADEIRKVAEVKKSLDDIETGLGDRKDEFRARWEILKERFKQGANLYSGSAQQGTFDYVKSFSLSGYSSDVINGVRVLSEQKCHDIENRISLVEGTGDQQIQRVYERVTEEWLRKARFVMSETVSGLLERMGKAKFMFNASSLLERLAGGSGLFYIEDTFVRDMTSLYQELNEGLPLARGLITRGMKEFTEGELYDTYDCDITGTTWEDGNRFGREFGDRLRYSRQRGNVRAHWESRDPLQKHQIGELTEQLQSYNTKYNTHLKIILKRQITPCLIRF